uniref:Uncharacterized protein n=1 Tax=Anguilla anguilla TaxID=7936 RepID=A0A0E9R7F9_ANGAN
MAQLPFIWAGTYSLCECAFIFYTEIWGHQLNMAMIWDFLYYTISSFSDLLLYSMQNLQGLQGSSKRCAMFPIRGSLG